MTLDGELKELLLEKCDTPAFKVSEYVAPSTYAEVKLPNSSDENISFKVETDPEAAVIKDVLTVDNMVYIVDKMSEVIIDNEIPFCELDSHAGDGDFGMSIAKGFRQLKREWAEMMQAAVKGIQYTGERAFGRAAVAGAYGLGVIFTEISKSLK